MKTPEDIWESIESNVLQHKKEFIWLLHFIKKKKYESILEIGSYKGGTALGFHLLGLRVNCIDKEVTPELKHLCDVYTDIKLIEGDSVKIHERIGGSYDVLFIDGDHSYEGCRADFENYKKNVREGGAIIFHDINPTDGNNFYGSSIFWDELKDLYPDKWIEYRAHPDTWGAFGILFV